MVRAARVFTKRKEEGGLPIPLDDAHSVGQFIGTEYSPHRYPL